ncbi:taperin, partial [Tupaia chinensis]
GLAGSPNGLGEWKPKVESGETSLHSPPSPGAPSAIPTASSAFSTLSPSSATPSQRRWVSAATSANDSFEIRPAPKPDVETIPPGDLQARALASLRAHSRNSFVFIPKRKVSGSPPPQGRQSVQLQEGEVGQAFQSPKQGGQLVPEADGLPALGRSPLVEVQWAAEERDCPRPSPALADPAVGWQRPASPPACMLAAAAEPAQGSGAPSLVRNGPELARPGLPITFIDEVASEEQVSQEAKLPDSGIHTPPRYCRQPAGPGHAAGLQQQGSNTFTVVPRRKLGVLQEQYSGQANGEPQPQVTEEEGPCATLVTAPKKRYPTVHEIEVIGGYLALRKSCLTKASSSRKKMKISFNDKSLQTTFEYPSESSLVQEEEAKATEETEEETEEEEESELGSEKPFALFLPRATFVGSVGSESPRLPGGSSGLSSYTPKHTMAFSKWQEQTLEQAQSEAESPPQEVMLTPASRNDHSDFCSEPALHF